MSVEDIAPADLDVLIIPGGFAPEGMRRSQPLLDLVRKTYEDQAIVAAICHAGWVLVSAGLPRGPILRPAYRSMSPIATTTASWLKATTS